MTLWDLEEERVALVMGFVDGISPAYQQRLQDLGFHISQKVTCLKCLPFGGPKVIAIGTSVYSLSKELALSMTISPVTY